MSVLFQTVINRGKFQLLKKTWNGYLSPCKCLFIRKYSDVPRKFATFDEIVAQRRAEARRSVVVQVNSESSFNELYGYCSKFAEINGIHHYKNSGGEHFMLIEFSTEENLKDVLRNCGTHQKDVDYMAVPSPFLWFRAVPGKKEKFSVPATKSLIIKDGTTMINEDKLSEELLNCASVTDQIQLLYDKTKLNDLGVRLRYVVARQLELLFDSVYANVAVWPFGSSVNGFGKMDSDLDLVLTNTLTNEMMQSDHRLVFHEKHADGNGGRSVFQRHVELLGELLELRAAGAGRAARVLHARVPIVKYRHELAGLHCDLAYTNMSGVHMSEMLWALGALDARARPLAGAVRAWARAAGLTSAHPGRWLTNFPLTLLVLFFLQQRDTRLLPSFAHLVRLARKEDVRLAEDNINCTFLRDMNQLPPDSYGQNSDNLETLLFKFFEFYAQFDFQEKAISVIEGKAVRKPNGQPLYIMNPLEQGVNVSRNVSFEELEKLQMEVRNAAWHLESISESEKLDDWGILGLIEKKSYRGLKKLLRVGNSHRLVSVKDLFNDTTDNIPENSLRSKLERLTQKSEKEVEKSTKEVEENIIEMKSKMHKEKNMKQKQKNIKFKNSQIASEVYRIRRDKIL